MKALFSIKKYHYKLRLVTNADFGECGRWETCEHVNTAALCVVQVSLLLFNRCVDLSAGQTINLKQVVNTTQNRKRDMLIISDYLPRCQAILPVNQSCQTPIHPTKSLTGDRCSFIILT